MTGEDQAAAVAAAAGLTESFQQMTAQMARLSRTGRRNRRILIGLAVSLTLDLLITAGLGWNTLRANSVQAGLAATQAAIRDSDIRQCQAANVARAEDIAIWNRLLTVPPGSPAAAKAEAAELALLVRVKDTPRDCVAAYPQ